MHVGRVLAHLPVHVGRARNLSQKTRGLRVSPVLSSTVILHDLRYTKPLLLEHRFNEQYVPWLNFELYREPGIPTPVLDLACCLVASRHWDEHTQAIVCPRLQKLTEETVIKIIFNSRQAESLESIQTLLILSLWSPVHKSGSGIRDGRLLIASAVSMAMNLRLSEASRKVADYKVTRNKPDGSLVTLEELEECKAKARVVSCCPPWFSLLSFLPQPPPKLVSDCPFLEVDSKSF